MSRLSENLITDDDDGSLAPRTAKKKSRKTRITPRVAADSLYSTTATPHSDDGYTRMPSERRDDVYASSRQQQRDPVVAVTDDAEEEEEEEEEDEALTEAELADGKRRRYTCWGACRGCHMTKTQYALSILLMVLLAITTALLIVFLAVVPGIINSTIDSANIAITSVSITNPTTTSFHLNSSFTLSNTGSFAATLAPMTVTLTHRLTDNTLSQPVGTLNMPAITLPGGEDVTITVDTDFAVANRSTFDQFMHATLLQENITWHLSSSVSVTGKVGDVTMPTYHSIPFDKDIVVAGLGGLNDTSVESFNLSHPSTIPGAVNLTLLIDIFNPSQFKISPLGDLHFQIFYQSIYVGDIYSKDVHLQPGTNQLTMYGTLLQSNTTAETELIQQFISGQTALATAVAASDASTEQLFNGGMQGLTLRTGLPGYTGQIIESLIMSDFSIRFNASMPSVAVVSSYARAAFTLPSNVDMPVLNISSVNISATAYLNDTAAMGTLTVTDAPLIYEPHTSGPDYLNITLTTTSLQVSTAQTAAFEQFASDLLLSPLATMQLQLTAATQTSTPLGDFPLSIPTNVTVPFIGMNRFISASTGMSLMSVVSYDIVRTASDWLLLDVVMNITNPSNVSLGALGDLRLDLYYNGTRIGRVTVVAFQLPLGMAQHQAIVNLTKPLNAVEEAAQVGLVSAMINQTSSNITLHGGLVQNGSDTVVAGTDIPLLQSAVSSFVASTVFPGLSQPLIDSFNVVFPLTYLYFVWGGCTQIYVNTSMHVRNPFSTYMYITRADIEVYINPDSPGMSAFNVTSLQYKLGDWHADLSANPLVVPPHSTFNSSVGPFYIRLTAGSTMPPPVVAYLFNLGAAENPLLLDSVGTMHTNLSGGGAADEAFEQRVYVDARNVTAKLQLTYPTRAPLPDNVLPPVTWGEPLLSNETCLWGCKTQCRMPCYCDAVLCHHGNCALGFRPPYADGMRDGL